MVTSAILFSIDLSTYMVDMSLNEKQLIVILKMCLPLLYIAWCSLFNTADGEIQLGMKIHRYMYFKSVSEKKCLYTIINSLWLIWYILRP